MLRIRHCARYLRKPSVGKRSFTQCSALNGVHQAHDFEQQISTLIRKLPSKDEANTVMFKNILDRLPEDQMSKASAQILGKLEGCPNNNVILNLALQAVQPQDLSTPILNNLVQVIHDISKMKRVPKPVQLGLTKIFMNACNDQIIDRIRSGIKEYDGAFNKSLLVTLLLKTRQYEEAHGIVLDTLRSSGKIRGVAIELLINHLCYLNEVQKAEELIRLATLPGKKVYEIFPRTYSTFLSKAVELNEYEICRRIHKHILDRTYVDNGTLVRLAETLSHSKDYICIHDVKKLAMNKESFPIHFMKRIDRSIIDGAANAVGFEKAWKMLEASYQGESLEVVDYPYLKSNVNIDAADEVNKFIHEKMLLESHELKQFLLNLVIARFCDAGKADEAYHLIARSDLLKEVVSENTILQLAQGAYISKDVDTLNQTCDLVSALNLTFKQSKTIDRLLLAILDTEYWFQSFKMLERCEIENYKLRPELYSKLEHNCGQFSSTQHLQYK